MLSSPETGLLAADDVLPMLAAWHAAGARAALVTLLSTDGPGPRAIGAQMAVREDGVYAGYLSGGCLERNIVAEAQAAIAEARNRRVRFGGADGYFDLKLPCGAALDLYVDQSIDAAQTSSLLGAAASRRLAYRNTDLTCGASSITICDDATDDGAPSRIEGGLFIRPHRPPPRLLVLGSSPLVVALARVAHLTGLVLDVATPDDHVAGVLAAQGTLARRLTGPRLPEGLAPDAWTASVLAFHEHDSEPQLLELLLRYPGFYVGALGSRAVHEQRVATLAAMGLRPAELARLRGSIGAIPGAKTQAALALGIVTEVLAEARRQGFLD